MSSSVSSLALWCRLVEQKSPEPELEFHPVPCRRLRRTSQELEKIGRCRCRRREDITVRAACRPSAQEPRRTPQLPNRARARDRAATPRCRRRAPRESVDMATRRPAVARHMIRDGWWRRSLRGVGVGRGAPKQNEGNRHLLK